MRQIIKDNKLFLGLFVLFLLLGIYPLATMGKGDLLLLINSENNAFLDVFFAIVTRFAEVPAFIMVFFVFFIMKKRKEAWLVGVLGVLVLLTSFVLKSFFQHPRPKTFFEGKNLLEQLYFVEGVYINSGNTAFPSGHTMGAFALFSLISFIAPNKSWMPLIFFVLAVLVGLSRIYLVQHFFEDVYSGALLGVLLSLLSIWAFGKYFNKSKQPASV
ncbi:MAG: phosphatase PAP2 family protein [Saprospiraceae bacterium]